MNLSALAAAIVAVESGGNDMAVGDGGRSIGAYQISRAVVADVNRIHGTRFTWKGMTNRADADRVFRLYVSHYCETDEQAARTWNGGPRGPRKQATAKYWRKVQREIDNRGHR